MRPHRLRLATLICAAAVASQSAASLAASPAATTGDATSVTATSALLNGVALPSAPDSAWTFQIGTTTAYGAITGAEAIDAGLHALSVTVRGLEPGTTYHFRLVVQDGSSHPIYEVGVDQTFTTKAASSSGSAYARTSLGARHLSVRHGVVAIPIMCAGAEDQSCRGHVLLTARDRHGRRIACASGSLGTRSGATLTVIRARLGRACVALLHGSRRRTLHATLRATFTTPQLPLTAPVTLLGS